MHFRGHQGVYAVVNTLIVNDPKYQSFLDKAQAMQAVAMELTGGKKLLQVDVTVESLFEHAEQTRRMYTAFVHKLGKQVRGHRGGRVGWARRRIARGAAHIHREPVPCASSRSHNRAALRARKPPVQAKSDLVVTAPLKSMYRVACSLSFLLTLSPPPPLFLALHASDAMPHPHTLRQVMEKLCFEQNYRQKWAKGIKVRCVDRFRPFLLPP